LIGALGSLLRGPAGAVLAVCFLLNLAGRGMADIYAVFLLPLEHEFGWTRSQLTGVYAIYLLVNGFTAPLAGLLFDRLGPRWVFGCGITILGSAFFLAQWLGSLFHFYLFIGVMVGLAVSLCGMVPGSGLLSRWFRTRLSTAIGIAFSAVGMGTVIFVPLAQQVILQTDWRFTYRAFGTALLLLAPVENAVKHHVARHRGRVTVSLQAHCEAGRLRLDIANQGDAPVPASPPDPDGGLGLRNLRERLTARYGASARVELRAEARGMRLSLELPA